MAKQLNLLSKGRVIATALSTEMEQSYLEYAMSVIVGRALPDVRDGLKPVHRRILYAMHELGLTPDRPYRKCARVVGDVLGKYHPHGDQSVYDALVRMVQSFSSRYPLVAGHGNFGSVDNDPPAAMRYTETRLSSFGNIGLLEDVGEETVDFVGNFDNSQQEPTVLPAQLPMLILNGCSGIAVGMATNIPPHNLGEIVDALIALIDRPELTHEELLKIVPGPDFPTGGEIMGRAGIKDAYETGRGSITVRAVTRIEEVQPGRGRHRRPVIVVTEMPYQVNKAGCIEKIASLISQGRLEGIADLRDESDRDGMRVVIELKRESDPEVVLSHLYRLTPLQSNFGVIMLAIVDNQPVQLSLKEVLQAFLDFREETLTRRYRHQLEQAQTRIHVVEGLRSALGHLDDVIEILRSAADGTTAKYELQNQLDLSDRQADAILSMPMRRLTGLEQQRLQEEFEELTRQIEDLDTLLGSRTELFKALKQDLRALKRQHKDARRTHLHFGKAAKVPVVYSADDPVTVEVSQRGYVRALRVTPRPRPHTADWQEQPRDLPLQLYTTKLDDELVTFTHSGKAYQVPLQLVPITSTKARGVPLMTLQPESAHQEEIATCFFRTAIDPASNLIFLTAQGRIKRLPWSDFTEITARGLGAIKLKDDDQLRWVVPVLAEREVAIATSTSRILRIPISEVPEMGRTAQGNRALRLRKQEKIVGMVALNDDGDLTLISGRGYCKRLPIDFFRIGKLGDVGGSAMQFATKADTLIAALPAPAEADILVTTDQDRIAYLSTANLQIAGKEGAGKQLLKPQRGEQLVEATLLYNHDANGAEGAESD
ncbi:MAG: DNA gyrase subunit A [Thermosynechococcaceae cyanobacterium]